jgi:hypothetical protein
MAAYAGDTLLYRDRVFRLSTRPLEVWFRLIGERPVLRRTGQGFARPSQQTLPSGPIEPSAGKEPVADYAATWEIDQDGLLQLVGLAGSWPDTNPLAVGHLFPFAADTVAATWFTGTLRGVRAGSIPAALALLPMPAMPALSDQSGARDGKPTGGWRTDGFALGDLVLEIRAGRLLSADGGFAGPTPEAGVDAVLGSPYWARSLV